MPLFVGFVSFYCCFCCMCGMCTLVSICQNVYGCQRTTLESVFSFCTGFWVLKLGLQMCAANVKAISALLILLYFFETGSCCIAEASLRCTVYLKVTSNSQSCFSLPCVGITDVYRATFYLFIQTDLRDFLLWEHCK